MWNDLYAILPFDIVNHLRLVTEEISEIRIRRGSALCVTLLEEKEEKIVFKNIELGLIVNDSLMTKTILALTDRSLYSHESTLKEGYITVQGCYRVGVVGKAVCDNGVMMTLRSIDGINIRLWRELSGIADPLYRYIKERGFRTSALVFSAPGMGKTTVLRDLTISLSQRFPHKRVSLVDSRSEIATPAIQKMSHIDVLSNYPKAKGIEIATRVMTPEYILCDEIGMLDEIEALESVQNSGVPSVMTVHAKSIEELVNKRIFSELHKKHFFDVYVQIDRLLAYGKAGFVFNTWEEVHLC